MRADAQEIDMDGAIRDRIERDVLGQCARGLAGHVDHHHRIHEMTRHQQAHQRLFLDMDRDRVLLVAVDHGGYAAVTTQ